MAARNTLRLSKRGAYVIVSLPPHVWQECRCFSYQRDSYATGSPPFSCETVPLSCGTVPRGANRNVCRSNASGDGISANRGLVLRLAQSALPPFSRGRILSTSAEGIRAAYFWYQGAESRAATRILGRRRPTSDGSGSPAAKTASWRRRTMTARTGDDETTGSSDVSLWGSGDLAHVAAQRRTSAPLPPPTPCGGIYVRRPRRAAASSSGAYTCLTAVDTGHRLWIGMDTRDLELFHCPGTATPAAPWGVCTGTERNGSTANDQDIITAAQAVRSREAAPH